MMGIDSCGMLISAVHHENGEEKLHLLMVDPHIPAGAKLYWLPLIGLKKPLVHQSVHQFTPRVHHGWREKCAIKFQPRRSDSAGLFFENYIFRYETRWEMTGSYFLRSLRLLNRCSGRFFAFWNRHKKFFWKSVGISQKNSAKRKWEGEKPSGNLENFIYIHQIHSLSQQPNEGTPRPTCR